ncbi:SYM1 (YLR251W) [Zygosaccharomyces parabailii]|nr:SYM1 (YLR251W) [Zygosaccharomyces parabailii]
MIASRMKRAFAWYANTLREHPKAANSVMTGTLFGTGDLIAQWFFPNSRDDKQQQGYDFARTARSVIYGSCIFSFIGDQWYKILNSKIRLPNQPQSSILNTTFRVAVDQLCFAPMGIPLYFFCLTLLEGGTLNDARIKIHNLWWGVLTKNWVIWPAVQALNFSFVPVQHRLQATNIVAIVWNTYLSYKNSIGK